MSDFPKFSGAAQQGEKGLRLVTEIISDNFKWIFRRTHQENDFGIDGYIEFVTDDGFVTGQMLGAQIKYGSSYIKETNRWGYIYRGEMKHLNYLANHIVPVVIIVGGPETDEFFWEVFSPELTQSTGSNWKITVPFDNKLRESKIRIEALLPSIQNYKGEMEDYWVINQLLSDSGLVMLSFAKEDVEKRDFKALERYVSRLMISKEIAFGSQGKVEIIFHDYDNDPRELFEVPEVRNFAAEVIKRWPEIFYFLNREPPHHSLLLLALCAMSPTILDRNFEGSGRGHVEYDTDELEQFLLQAYLGLNRVADWLSLSEEEVERLSLEIARPFGLSTED